MKDERRYSTNRAAKIFGLSQPRLQFLIKSGRIVAPPLIDLFGMKVRLWSMSEIRTAKKELRRDRRKRKKRP